MHLSKRLLAVCNMLKEGKVAADVGTDHGYSAIYLVQEHICERAIAMDVRKGPLGRAQENVRKYNLEDRIETRLSDGLDALKPGEADCMIAAGMGGPLMIHILDEGRAIVPEMKECILQPQSEIAMVRKYVWEHGFSIEEEQMVLEEGKFYPIMRVVPGRKQSVPEELYELYAQYGQFLLDSKNLVLGQFLYRELNHMRQLTERLERQPDMDKTRLEQLYDEKRLLEKAVSMMEE